MQKLEDLVIEKVAFVEAGDNKRANIVFTKSKPKAPDDPEPPTDNPQLNNDNEKKGVTKEMKFNKSKMTADELKLFEELEKKYAEDVTSKEKETTSETTKDEEVDEEEEEEKRKSSKSKPTSNEDIYKDLHPAVVEEIRALRKRADEAEERELLSISKKYEILGKKPDELAKTLKTLKDAGGTAYNDMISIMDSSVEAINKSGVFSEIGKSGSNSKKDEGAWGQIEGVARELRKSKPEMSHYEAINEACKQRPDLVAEYESNINI